MNWAFAILSLLAALLGGIPGGGVRAIPAVGSARTSRRLDEGAVHSVLESDSCGAHVPKVALVMMAVDEVGLEPVWAPWFQAAGSLVPRSALAGRDAAAVEKLRSACTHPPSAGILARQNLFSVYVHRPADRPDMPSTSLFRSVDIPNRVKVEYGEHSMVEAVRQLLRAALEDLSNHKFALLSESCAPLYPAVAVYQQLVVEPASRINACSKGDRQEYRYVESMGRGPHAVRPEEWRWSSMWAAFRRDHASIVAADVHFNGVFRLHCVFKDSGCMSDEHYVPTLLSKLGKETETDCAGLLTRDSFTGGYHPRTYEVPEVTAKLWEEMRGCQPPPYTAVRGLYIDLADPLADATTPADATFAWLEGTLGSSCPLFARKFPKRAAKRIRDTLFDCRSGLEFVSPCAQPVGVAAAENRTGMVVGPQ